MKERKEFHRTVLDREIRVTVEYLDYGLSITIFGGDKSHIGATVVEDDEGKLHSIGLPGHRELEICEEWVRDLYAVTHEPVSVTAGVHYNEISRDNLKIVIRVLEELKEEVKETISEGSLVLDT